MPNFKLYAAVALIAVIVFFGGSIAMGSFYTIDQTERGVLLRNGALKGIQQPGLGFKLPFIETVEKFPVTDRIQRWTQLEGYSYDQQPAHYIISVQYRLNPGDVDKIYTQYYNEDNVKDRLIAPAVLRQSKVIIGQYTAQSTIQNRAKLNADIFDAISKQIDGPITIIGVNVEDIQFSAAYVQSIESRMIAEVKVQQLEQQRRSEEVQAHITVIQAQAKADSNLAEAKAKAQAIELAGEAEAKAITLKGDALKANPVLVELTKAERWDGKLPATMIPNSTIPFLSAEK